MDAAYADAACDGRGVAAVALGPVAVASALAAPLARGSVHRDDDDGSATRIDDWLESGRDPS